MELVLLQSGNCAELDASTEFSHHFYEPTIISNMEFFINEELTTVLYENCDEKNDAPSFRVYKMKIIVDGKLLFSVNNPNNSISSINFIVNDTLTVLVDTKGQTDKYVYLNLRATKIL